MTAFSRPGQSPSDGAQAGGHLSAALAWRILRASRLACLFLGARTGRSHHWCRIRLRGTSGPAFADARGKGIVLGAGLPLNPDRVLAKRAPYLPWRPRLGSGHGAVTLHSRRNDGALRTGAGGAGGVWGGRGSVGVWPWLGKGGMARLQTAQPRWSFPRAPRKAEWRAIPWAMKSELPAPSNDSPTPSGNFKVRVRRSLRAQI